MPDNALRGFDDYELTGELRWRRPNEAVYRLLDLNPAEREELIAAVRLDDAPRTLELVQRVLR